MCSQVHLLPVDAHPWFVYEFVLTEFLIHSTELERMQLQGEPGPHLLQVGTRAISEEFITMVPEEDEVTLVVEGDNLTPDEVGVLGEEGGKHTTDALSGHRVKVVHDQLWGVIMGIGAPGMG